jgi:hypothetical protein
MPIIKKNKLAQKKVVDIDWVPAKIRKRTKESAREEEERDERTPATARIFCGLPAVGTVVAMK